MAEIIDAWGGLPDAVHWLAEVRRAALAMRLRLTPAGETLSRDRSAAWNRRGGARSPLSDAEMPSLLA